MANLFYPQLTSGALAQYPIQKMRATRTIRNVLADGTMIVYPDPGAGRLVWTLAYQELSGVDVGALQAHFANCAGPFHAFTFIDPTDNMLASSADLTQPCWTASSYLNISAVSDPNGGMTAFAVSNSGQTDGWITQTLQVPANYQYCLSTYVASAESFETALLRSGAQDQEMDSFAVSPTWTRLVSSGRLNDGGTTLTIGISVPAGEQLQVFGMQLEAQVAPSGYRATDRSGGVYPNAHWLNPQLIVTAEAPNLFSTAVQIETSI